MGVVTLARSASPQYPWRNAGSLTTEQAVLTTDKSAATVNALTSTGTVFIAPTDNTVAIELRFRCTGTEDVDDIVTLYGMRGTDHYTRMATLTLINGTQTDGTYTFHDTVTIGNEKWIDDIVDMSDAADGIARVCFNTHGYSKFLLIANDLDNDAILVDWVRV